MMNLPPLDFAHRPSPFTADMGRVGLGNTDGHRVTTPNLDITGRFIGPEEQALAKRFADLVWCVKLEDVLNLATDRTAPPRNLGDYRLAPIVAKVYRHSSLPGGSYVTEPYGIEFDYKGKGQPPYLDSSFAVGLVYRDRLSAVAAAHHTPEGHLRIVQIQSVAPPAKAPKDKYASGLHGGFLWRDTLVETWIGIANELGVSHVEILGGMNNKWRDDTGLYAQRDAGLIAGYDRVAKRMGFTFDEESSNWSRYLSPPESPPFDFAIVTP